MSYVILGLFSVLITTYLIPILKIYQNYDKKSKAQFPHTIYFGFVISYFLIYFLINFLKTLENTYILGFLFLVLFVSLISHSILLILNITIVEILKGIKIKSFKQKWLTSIFFGIKFSLLQILCNPVFFLVVIIQILAISSNLEAFLKFGLYFLGLIITINIILNLSNKKYDILLKKISTKQKTINFMTSILTILIAIVFILNFI